VLRTAISLDQCLWSRVVDIKERSVL
jgi:hypothetical protein